MKLTRRSFLGFAAAGAAGLLLPELLKVERTFCLPPSGGWHGVDTRYPLGDVRRYGAVGDGVADDTAAIQAAIDAGGVVHLAGGNYRIARSLRMKNLNGTGLRDGQLLPTRGMDHAIYIDNCDGLLLANLTIPAISQWFGS